MIGEFSRILGTFINILIYMKIFIYLGDFFLYISMMKFLQKPEVRLPSFSFLPVKIAYGLIYGRIRKRDALNFCLSF